MNRGVAFCVGIVFVAGAIHDEAAAADSRAEIQVNLCGDPESLLQLLTLAEKGKPTTVWLFDSADLELNRAGLRLRLRQQGRRSELTLKRAGQDCAAIQDADLQPDGKCEADLHGASMDDVVSLTQAIDAHARRALLAPERARGAPLVEALSASLNDNQRRALAAQAGATDRSAPLPPAIVRLGPSTVRSYGTRSQPYVVEIWTLPGGQRFVELSEKVRRDRALVRRADILRHLAATGVEVCRDQESQAKRKLTLMAR